MKNKGVLIIAGAILGLIVGYLVFGKQFGGYVSISALFDFSGGDLGNFGRSVGGVKAIQQKVLISTIVGATAAYLYSIIKKK